jgi:hypothetical protein
MTALLAMIATAASIAASAPAPVPRWSLDMSLGGSYVTDRSFDLVSDVDALPSAELRVGLAPGWLNRHLELDLALGIDGNSGSTFQAWETSFTDWGVQLGLRYRQPLGHIFSAYGRVAGVVDLDRLRLSTGGDSPALSQTVLSPGVQFGAGVEVQLASWSGGRFGFTFEVDYVLHPAPARFDALTPDGDGAPTPIAFVPVDAGSVNLSGLRWRLGAAVHF